MTHQHEEYRQSWDKFKRLLWLNLFLLKLLLIVSHLGLALH